MENIQELKKILREVGPEKIWRHVYDRDNHLLARGIGEAVDGLPEDMPGVDFRGKTIVDLGCNFGYYTFFVKKAGARRVLGIDIDKRMVRGCEILKDHYRIDGVSFLEWDITRWGEIGKFDMGMMIDFIGKTMVKTGLLKNFLSVLEKFSEKEMLLTLRRRYHLRKNLDGDIRFLKKKYSGYYIRGNFFYTVDYVRDLFKDRWNLRFISPKKDPDCEDKETLHFLKR
jgi:SAM-dependent methyltransferase